MKTNIVDIKELMAQHNLTEDEYKKIVEILGREPNITELGMFSVMWSEHCSYKSSRVHLKKLPTTGPRVVQGPGENAGAVDIGDGLCVVFKMESHNHPSFIEPYQGAATGVGGILRDVFTMGARPIALLDSLRFGGLDTAKNRHLMKGVVAGIAGYGNCMGVPTVGGEVRFDDIYSLNPLVNAFCLGIAHKDKIFRGTAAGVGNPVIYFGSKTGRDGIHGATMASDAFDDQSEQKRPTVQVGDPVPGKIAAGSLSRIDGRRPACRHSGHGCGRADELVVRNGLARRERHRTGSDACASPRAGHDAVRIDALRVSRTHVDGGQSGQGRGVHPDLQEVGSRRGGGRQGDGGRDPAGASIKAKWWRRFQRKSWPMTAHGTNAPTRRLPIRTC